MAGPRFLSTGGVVDPYQGLQSAVSNVGQIYQNYEENARKDSEFRAQEAERNRIKGMREFATGYDSRVGEDYRGINANMRPLVEQSEVQAKQRWQAANPQATAEQSAAFDNELRNVRRSLASAEDVAATVTNDYIRAGFSPEQADAYGRQAAVGYNSRGAALAQAQAEADARNQVSDKLSQRLLDLYQIQSASDNASIRALGSSSGTGSRTGAKTGGGASSSFATPAKLVEAEEYLSDALGGGDAKQALSDFQQGLSLYNEKAKANGGSQLSFEQAQNVALSNISRGGALTDNKALYSDPADFAALLTAQYGPADATNRAGVSGSNGAVDRQTLVSNARTQLSNAEREAILNPSRTVINPEQVARQQVASAYARLFPQAAEENRVAASRTSAATSSAPSRITAAVNQSERYRVTSPAPLESGATRGTGFTTPNNQASQVSPAGVPSSPDTQTITPARALAEEIVSYQQTGTSGDIDLPRSLQALQVRNPELYQSVAREQANINRERLQSRQLAEQISILQNRARATQANLASQDPSRLSTEETVTGSPSLFNLSGSGRFGSSFTPTRNPSEYQRYLQQEQYAKNLQTQIAELQQRQASLSVSNAPKDFTALKAILGN